MKLTIIITSILFSISVFSAPKDSYECFTEVSGGDEVIIISFENSKMNIFLEDAMLGSFSYKEIGNMQNYGESVIEFHQNEITLGSLTNSYDETILDISSLHLNLSDQRFMCN